MNQIAQSDLYERYVQEVRSKRTYVNCYLSMITIKEKIDSGQILGFELQDGLLLMEMRNGIQELFFFCDDLKWIAQINQIKNMSESMLINIIQGKADKIDYQQEFLNYGYQPYKKYERLRLSGTNVSVLEGTCVDFCDSDDKADLRNVMDTSFDVKSDHIPDDDELNGFIETKSIICVRQNREIAGFIIFEDKGKTSYIRMVCVKESYRGCGIGSELMKMYFGIHEGFKSFTLWYDTTNIPALKLYSRWGYREEYMYNLIYTI